MQRISTDRAWKIGAVGPPLYFSHRASLEHETGEHPERPARILAIERELERRDWLGYERREAPAATRAALTAVHAEEYVDAVRSMSERGGGALDGETLVSAGTYRAAVRAAGAACAMVEALICSSGCHP